MSLATKYRNLNVKPKLRLIIMATVTAALLCACVAVLVYVRVAERDSMRNDLAVMAEMVGANSTAALSFEDSKVGDEILSSLSVKRQIVAARILTAGGRTLASYRRAAAPPSAMPSNMADGVWFEPNRLIAFKSIVLGGSKLGTVYLESDLDQLNTTLRRFAYIVAAILAAAWLLGLVLEKMPSIKLPETADPFDVNRFRVTSTLQLLLEPAPSARRRTFLAQCGHAAAEKAPFAEKYAACLLAFAIADHPPGGC